MVKKLSLFVKYLTTLKDQAGLSCSQFRGAMGWLVVVLLSAGAYSILIIAGRWVFEMGFRLGK
jgi:hypothetical protein